MQYDAHVVQQVATRSLDKGIYVICFFYMAVAKDQARIRTQISVAHTKQHPDKAIDVFREVGIELGITP